MQAKGVSMKWLMAILMLISIATSASNSASRYYISTKVIANSTFYGGIGLLCGLCHFRLCGSLFQL